MSLSFNENENVYFNQEKIFSLEAAHWDHRVFTSVQNNETWIYF